MCLPLYVLPIQCRVAVVSSMAHLQLHTLPIRASGPAPNHHLPSSSHCLDQFLKTSCHLEVHHHLSLQWPRDLQLLKCLIPLFPLNTLCSQVPHQASTHLLLLMHRIIYLLQDSLVLHHRLTSLQLGVLLQPSQGHLLVTLRTDSLLHPTSQGPGVHHHLSMVIIQPNPRWQTHLVALQNSITRIVPILLS